MCKVYVYNDGYWKKMIQIYSYDIVIFAPKLMNLIPCRTRTII